jgi:hypothetical protein
MGTYRLSIKEIADILETLEDSGGFEGDFSESDLVDGARLFCRRLRKDGAFVPK